MLPIRLPYCLITAWQSRGTTASIKIDLRTVTLAAELPRMWDAACCCSTSRSWGSAEAVQQATHHHLGYSKPCSSRSVFWRRAVHLLFWTLLLSLSHHVHCGRVGPCTALVSFMRTNGLGATAGHTTSVCGDMLPAGPGARDTAAQRRVTHICDGQNRTGAGTARRRCAGEEHIRMPRAQDAS